MLKSRMMTTRSPVLPVIRLAQGAEVDPDHDGDEHPEQDQEMALLGQVGLAGLPDQLGDVLHRLVGGQLADLEEDDEAEEQTQAADDQAQGKKECRPTCRGTDVAQVGQDQARLAPAAFGGQRGRREGQQ